MEIHTKILKLRIKTTPDLKNADECYQLYQEVRWNRY